MLEDDRRSPVEIAYDERLQPGLKNRKRFIIIIIVLKIESDRQDGLQTHEMTGYSYCCVVTQWRNIEDDGSVIVEWKSMRTRVENRCWDRVRRSRRLVRSAQVA